MKKKDYYIFALIAVTGLFLIDRWIFGQEKFSGLGAVSGAAIFGMFILFFVPISIIFFLIGASTPSVAGISKENYFLKKDLKEWHLIILGLIMMIMVVVLYNGDTKFLNRNNPLIELSELVLLYGGFLIWMIGTTMACRNILSKHGLNVYWLFFTTVAVSGISWWLMFVLFNLII